MCQLKRLEQIKDKVLKQRIPLINKELMLISDLLDQYNEIEELDEFDLVIVEDCELILKTSLKLAKIYESGLRLVG